MLLEFVTRVWISLPIFLKVYLNFSKQYDLN